MVLQEQQPVGREYLELATILLQEARRMSPTGGVWEAADIQWWWRADQHRDSRAQIFWLSAGLPVAAVLIMDWGSRWQCDVIRLGVMEALPVAELWRRALLQLESLPAKTVELLLRDDDEEMTAAVKGAGFAASDETDVTSWLTVTNRLSPPNLPQGFRLFDRSEMSDRPHHMAARNGIEIEARLQECSLYDQTLDLAVCAPTGEVACYGLFWPDPTTGIGLVEPMRTEDGHKGRHLATHLLRVGLDRLAGRGCERLKVSFDPANEPARRLYLGSGFEATSRATSYLRH